VSEGRAGGYEQLVYTSARRTLEGSGFGVLAHSAGWPEHFGLTGRSLGRLVAAPGGEDDDVALLRQEGGALLCRKHSSGEDALGRSGNYLVHLLWDPRGHLTLREVLSLLDGGMLLDSADGLEPTRELPRCALPPQPRRALPVVDVAEAEACVAAVLRRLPAGGSVELPPVLPSGGSSLAVLAAALPRGLLRLLSLVPAWATDPEQDGGVVTLRLRPAAALERTTETARMVMEDAGAGAPVPDALASLVDVENWLRARRWAADEPATLSARQIAVVLRSAEGEEWLLRGGAEWALKAAEEDADALRGLKTAAKSAAARELVTGEAVRLLADALLTGRPTPKQALRIALLEVDRIVDMMLTLQDLGGIDDLDDAGRRLVEPAFLAAPTLQPARLFHPALLSELIAVPAVADAALRSLAEDDPLIRRRTAEALLASDPDWLESLTERLPDQEVHDLLSDEAREADEERLDQLVAAAARLPGQRGFALRSLLWQAPPGPAAVVLARRAGEVLAEDGWPPELLRHVELSHKRSAWRRLAGRG
jgi:hypothetical protein